MEGWIHTPIEDEEQYKAEVKEICDIYSQARDLHKEGIYLVSVDEKTEIQALERVITQMKQGQWER